MLQRSVKKAEKERRKQKKEKSCWKKLWKKLQNCKSKHDIKTNKMSQKIHIPASWFITELGHTYGIQRWGCVKMSTHTYVGKMDRHATLLPFQLLYYVEEFWQSTWAYSAGVRRARVCLACPLCDGWRGTPANRNSCCEKESDLGTISWLPKTLAALTWCHQAFYVQFSTQEWILKAEDLMIFILLFIFGS